jgi:hypothetical protein
VTSSNQRSRRTGNLTDHQAGILVEQFTSQADRIIEIIDMFNAYAEAGGRDWASYERIFDHLSREGIKLVQYSHSALDPELQDRAQRAVAAAAARTPGPDGQPGAIHQKVAGSVPATVYYAGWHHLLEAKDWPDELSAVVLDTVRRAPRIKDEAATRSPETGGRAATRRPSARKRRDHAPPGHA